MRSGPILLSQILSLSILSSACGDESVKLNMGPKIKYLVDNKHKIEEIVSKTDQKNQQAATQLSVLDDLRMSCGLAPQSESAKKESKKAKDFAELEKNGRILVVEKDHALQKLSLLDGTAIDLASFRESQTLAQNLAVSAKTPTENLRFLDKSAPWFFRADDCIVLREGETLDTYGHDIYLIAPYIHLDGSIRTTPETQENQAGADAGSIHILAMHADFGSKAMLDARGGDAGKIELLKDLKNDEANTKLKFITNFLVKRYFPSTGLTSYGVRGFRSLGQVIPLKVVPPEIKTHDLEILSDQYQDIYFRTWFSSLSNDDYMFHGLDPRKLSKEERNAVWKEQMEFAKSLLEERGEEAEGALAQKEILRSRLIVHFEQEVAIELPQLLAPQFAESVPPNANLSQMRDVFLNLKNVAVKIPPVWLSSLPAGSGGSVSIQLGNSLTNPIDIRTDSGSEIDLKEGPQLAPFTHFNAQMIVYDKPIFSERAYKGDKLIHSISGRLAQYGKEEIEIPIEFSQDLPFATKIPTGFNTKPVAKNGRIEPIKKIDSQFFSEALKDWKVTSEHFSDERLKDLSEKLKQPD